MGIAVSKMIKWNTVASHSAWLCAHFPLILMPTLVFHLQIMRSKTRIRMFLILSFQELLSVSHPFYAKYRTEHKKCVWVKSQRICTCSSLWNYSLFRRIKSSVEGKSDRLCFFFSSHSFPDSCVLAAPWLVALLSFLYSSLYLLVLQCYKTTCYCRSKEAIQYSPVFTSLFRRGAAAAGCQHVGGLVEASESRRLGASRRTFCICHMPLLSLFTWRGCQKGKRWAVNRLAIK